MTNTINIAGTDSDPIVPTVYDARTDNTVIWVPLNGETILSIVPTSGSFSTAPGVGGANDGSWSAVIGSFDKNQKLNYTILLSGARGTSVTRAPYITSNPAGE